jgi:hypothetical protein
VRGQGFGGGVFAGEFGFREYGVDLLVAGSTEENDGITFGPADVPAVSKSFSDFDECREEWTQMAGVQRVRDHTSLAFPVLALGLKDAVDAQFFGDRLDRAQATIQFRAVAQDLLDQFGIGNSDDLSKAHLKPIKSAELITPPLEDTMDCLKFS